MEGVLNLGDWEAVQGLNSNINLDGGEGVVIHGMGMAVSRLSPKRGIKHDYRGREQGHRQIGDPGNQKLSVKPNPPQKGNLSPPNLPGKGLPDSKVQQATR